MTQQVRHMDIVPDDADWAAHAMPARLDGVSLRPLLGPADAPAPPSYAESRFGRLHFGWSAMHTVRDGEWKYVDAGPRAV